MGKHLDRLATHRILDIEKLKDGKFRLWEECDHHFYEDFTPDDLRELAGEIEAIAGHQ